MRMGLLCSNPHDLDYLLGKYDKAPFRCEFILRHIMGM